VGDGDMSQRDEKTALKIIVPEVVGTPAMATDDELIDDFLGSKTKNTLRAYDGDLRDFAAFLGADSPQRAIAVLLSSGPGAANRVALRYKTDMTARGLKSSTVRRRIAALRSVVKLARKFGRIEWQLDCDLPPAEKCKDTRGPGDDGWQAMREQAAADAKGGSVLAIRDRAMLRICHDLGLRIAELISLDLEHIEVRGIARAAWVLGKGRKDRERLTIPENAGTPLSDWLAVRGTERGPLFVRLDRAAKGHARLTERSAARYIKKLGLRVGIDRIMSPHKLRHHAITTAGKRSGGNMVKMQKFSRHADPKMLVPYIDALTDEAGEIAEMISDKD
jgi:integrase/recombinase XerC